MSASPNHDLQKADYAADVLDRLAKCDHLMTAKELAAIVNIKAKTLYKYADSGHMPCFKVESNVRFHGPEIAAWLRQRRRQSRTLQAPHAGRGPHSAPVMVNSRG